MDRRVFLGTMAGGLLAAPLAAEAQPAGKMWRIGMAGLYAGQHPPEPLAIFRETLRAEGYVEGRNLALDIRDGDGTRERLDELYRQLINAGADILIAHSNMNAVAAKQATSSIPIVVLYAIDPVGVGLVASLGRPSGNLTGMSYDPASEHVAKLVEFLRQGVPSVTRLGILAAPQQYGSKGFDRYWHAVENTAARLHLPTKRFIVTRREDVDGVFRSIPDSRINGRIVLPLERPELLRQTRRAGGRGRTKNSRSPGPPRRRGAK